MAPKHLATGSTQPPKLEGKLRLYSMQFCPYAERVRIVLLKKQIPHDIINVDLKRKPEWLHALNPKELVPVLDTGSKILIESLDVCEYLEENYPETPLYSKNAEQSKKDKELIDFSGDLFPLFYKAVRNPENKPLSEYLEAMEPYLVKLEEELRSRGSYFGGKSANIVDYAIWPFAERAEVLKLLYNQDLPNEEKYPRIYGWCKEMRKLEEINETITSTERLHNFVLAYKNTPTCVDYDSI